MGTGAGWPDVALALIEFAKAHPILFLLTVPLTRIVILVGTLLLLKIGVFAPLDTLGGAYRRQRRQHQRSDDPELPLK